MRAEGEKLWTVVWVLVVKAVEVLVVELVVVRLCNAARAAGVWA